MNAHNSSPEALSWLLQILAPLNEYKGSSIEIEKRLGNCIFETASTAGVKMFGYASEDYSLFYTPCRADAVVLMAMMDSQDQTLVTKLIKGMLASRTNGQWLNTQENAVASLALAKYFSKYESASPDFSLRGWLDRQFVMQQEFRKRDKITNSLTIPMAFMQEQHSQSLLLDKQGPGRLYYRLGLKYALNSTQQMKQSSGFELTRRYISLGDQNDVTLDPAGVWHIKAGALVKVQIDCKVSSRRFHVALVDSIPAGMEALDPGILGTVTAPSSASEKATSCHRFFPEHENLRDDRVEAFRTLLPEGAFRYSYLSRATTRGKFAAPAARAEEMYNPETFGTTKSDTVVVE